MAQRPPVRTSGAAEPPKHSDAPAAVASSSSARPASSAPAPDAPDKGASSGKDSKESDARERERDTRDRWRSLRAANLAPKRPDAAFLKTLSSDIKRNTSFIRKLRLGGYGTVAAGEALISEFNGLNLSRYVSEAVAAIAEAPLKTVDVPLTVRLVSAIHQRYADFAAEFVAAMLKFLGHVKGPEPDADKTARLARKRVTTRLLVELYEAGVYTESGPLTATMQDLSVGLQGELRDKSQEAYAHLPLFVAFLRAAADLLGLARPTDAPPAPPDAATLPGEVQRQVVAVAESAFDAVSRALQAEHRAVRGKERENQRMLETRGELTEAASASYDRLRKIHERLQSGLAGLAELLGRPMPALPDETQTTRIAAAVEGGLRPSTSESGEAGGVWEDEDTRAFYETLPDLRLLVPAVLLGGGAGADGGAEAGAEGGKDEVDDVIGEEKKADDLSTTPTAITTTTTTTATAPAATITATAATPSQVTLSAAAVLDANAPDSSSSVDDESTAKSVSVGAGQQLDLILARLAACANREAADALAVEFCYVNNKSSRRRLVKALHALLPRIQMVQLPCLARLVATLSQCVKDIGPPLVALLEGEFMYLLGKKDQSAASLEQRQRNARFVAELTKFRVCPAASFFHALKACLDEFTHHNVDVVCTLLEAAGRFLYKQQDTHVRMANLLEVMMRRKASKALDARQDLMVENAFYLCKPPERSAHQAKKQPSALEAYVQQLLYAHLAKPTARHVLKQLRMLPWADEARAGETEAIVLRACVKAHRAKFSHVHLLASVVAGLSAYQDQLGVRLVDLLLERIRAGLDDADVAHLQRRVVQVKLLGELYNYTLFESALLFDVLHLLINLHPATQAPIPERADAPTEFFRLRLVCTLLDTSGSYFDRGSARRRLDRYLVYVQRYVLAKAVPPPVDVAYMLSDTLEALRPHLVRFTTLDQANDAVRQLEADDARAAGHTAPAPSRTPAADDEDDDDEADEGDGDESGGEEGEDEEGDEEGDEGSSTSSGSDESASEGSEADEAADEAVHVKRANGGRGTSREEEDEFDKELQRVLHESHEQRKVEARAVKAASADIAVPMHLLRSAPAGARRVLPEHEPRPAAGSAAPAATADGADVVHFQVLLRKGSKQQTRTLNVPMSTPLAAASKAATAAELAEQEEVKRFVLEYGDREDEEAAQRQVSDLLPTVQRGRGGLVRRVLHLSGGSGQRVGTVPDAPRGGHVTTSNGHAPVPPRGVAAQRGGHRGGSGGTTARGGHRGKT